MSIRGGAVLYVKELHRVREFYARVIGLPSLRVDAEHVVLGGGGFELVLLQVSEQMGVSIEITNPPRRREENPTKLVFFVESIDAARKMAPDHGGEINRTEKPWLFDGHKVCDGVDPEGNMIQLRERVSSGPQ